MMSPTQGEMETALRDAEQAFDAVIGV